MAHWKNRIETVQSDDDEVRIAKVKTSEGIYTRLISKLCLLEEQKDI